MKYMVVYLSIVVNIYALDIDVEYTNPYYMDINTTISLSDEKIQTISEKNEFLLYKKLLIGSFVPKFLYLEASLYAMPTIGASWKSLHQESYNAMSIEDVDLVQMFFAGFEEPYAVSMFLGKVVKFGVDDEDISDDNKGFVGYLFSYGNYHLKSLEFIEDNWLEIEWKVKGKKMISTQSLDWSFRIGGKIHSHPNISNTYYLGLRRNNVDVEETIPFLSNSAFEYKVDFRADTLDIIRNYLTLDKKYLLFGSKKSVALVIGFVHENRGKYTGKLQRDVENMYSFILRPNISF